MPKLTKYELEVVKLLVEDKTTKQAAAELGVSPKTVEGHRVNVYRKLNFSSPVALTKWAIRTGMTTVCAVLLCSGCRTAPPPFPEPCPSAKVAQPKVIPPQTYSVTLTWDYPLSLPQPNLQFNIFSVDLYSKTLTKIATVDRPPVAVSGPWEAGFFVCQAEDTITHETAWNQ